MRLHLHRSGSTFLAALKTGRDAYYAAFARSTIDPAVLREADEIANRCGHRDLADVAALRAPAERLLREFFDNTARGDPEFLFSHSSRVLLAVPDYPDITLLFLLAGAQARAGQERCSPARRKPRARGARTLRNRRR